MLGHWCFNNMTQLFPVKIILMLCLMDLFFSTYLIAFHVVTLSSSA